MTNTPLGEEAWSHGRERERERLKAESGSESIERERERQSKEACLGGFRVMSRSSKAIALDR